jgi:hypothetical protein
MPGGVTIAQSKFAWVSGNGVGGRLLTIGSQNMDSPIQPLLTRIGVRWRFPHFQTASVEFRDARTGEEVGGLPSWRIATSGDAFSPSWVVISPAEDLSAVEHNGAIRIWEISPGTPWTLFAAIVVVLAVLLSLFTRWRIRRQALGPRS